MDRLVGGLGTWSLVMGRLRIQVRIGVCRVSQNTKQDMKVELFVCPVTAGITSTRASKDITKLTIITTAITTRSDFLASGSWGPAWPTGWWKAGRT